MKQVVNTQTVPVYELKPVDDKTELWLTLKLKKATQYNTNNIDKTAKNLQLFFCLPIKYLKYLFQELFVWASDSLVHAPAPSHI